MHNFPFPELYKKPHLLEVSYHIHFDTGIYFGDALVATTGIITGPIIPEHFHCQSPVPIPFLLQLLFPIAITETVSLYFFGIHIYGN